MSFNRKIYTNLLKKKNLIINENSNYENENCFVVSSKFKEDIDYYETHTFNSDLFLSEQELRNRNYFYKFTDDFEKYNLYLKDGLEYNKDYILLDSKSGMSLYKIFENNTKYIFEQRIIKNNDSFKINLYNEEIKVFNLYLAKNLKENINENKKFKFKINIKDNFRKLDKLIDQITQQEFSRSTDIKYMTLKNKINSPPIENEVKNYDIDQFYSQSIESVLLQNPELIFVALMLNRGRDIRYDNFSMNNFQNLNGNQHSNHYMMRNNNSNYNTNNDILELPKGCVGMENLGNSCYMNSAIQALSHTPYFKEFILDEKYKNDINSDNPLGFNGKFIKKTFKVCEKIWNSNRASFRPYKYKMFISKCNVMFEGNEQHDSSEFLGYIIDNLHEDINLIKKKPLTNKIEAFDLNINDYYYGKISWINHLKRNHSFINSLFYGQYKSIIKCPDCKKISITYDPFQMLHLPVMKNIKKKLKMFILNTEISKVELNLKGDPNKINNFKLIEIKKFIFGKLNLIPNEYYSINYENAEKLNEEKMCFYEINFQNITLSFNKKHENYVDLTDENEYFEENKNKISVQLNLFNKLSYNYQFDEDSKLKDLYEKIMNLLLIDFNGKEILGDALDQEGLFYFDCYNETRIENFDVLLKNFFNYKNNYFNNYYRRKKTDTINSINLKNSLEISIFCNRRSEHSKIDILLNRKFSKIKFDLEFEKANKNIEEKNDLYNLLKKFSLPENLDENNTWFCSDCNNHKKATKILNIFKLPPILLIVLKKIKDYSSSDKENEVDFPFILDMEDFVYKENDENHIKDYEINKEEFLENSDVDESSLNLIPKTNSTKYELYAVINHIGTNEYGHYYSYIKINNIWYEFNDSRVKEINEKKIVTSAALVLLYKNI